MSNSATTNPMSLMKIITTGNERQDKAREKHVHACLTILKVKSKYERVKMFFMYYPATGNRVFSELSAKYNNLFWHFDGIVDGVKINDFGYDGDCDYISAASMRYYLEKMQAEGLASSKLWSRGWYARRHWSTHHDIPF